jgi:hypothetical protein
MDECARGFRIGEVLHPWGTRFDALVADDVGDGYASRDLPCSAAYGFETIYAEVTAAGADRPVTGVAYELANVLQPKDVFARLVIRLGQPDQVDRGEVPPSSHASSSVVLHASWKRGTYTVGLSIYGAPRPSSFGDGLGKLYVSWADTQAAAAPFIAEWTAANEALARASATASPTVFAVRYPIFDPAHEPPSPSTRALATPELFETPREAARRLGTRAFALWQDDVGSWYLSTGRDSVRLGGPDTSTVQVLDIAPARGGGYSALEVGSWRVHDAYRSSAIADAAAALERVPGLRIERHTGHDA